MGEHPRPLETEHPQILYLDVCPPFLHLANSHRERKLGVVLEDSEICAFIIDFVCFCYRFFSPSIWLRSPVVHWGNAQNSPIRSLGKAPKSFLQVLKIASGASTNPEWRLGYLSCQVQTGSSLKFWNLSIEPEVSPCEFQVGVQIKSTRVTKILVCVGHTSQVTTCWSQSRGWLASSTHWTYFFDWLNYLWPLSACAKYI